MDVFVIDSGQNIGRALFPGYAQPRVVNGGWRVGCFQLIACELLTQAGEKFYGNAHEAFYYSVLMDELETDRQILA